VPSAARVTATVAILPASARVSVDGQPREAPGGALALSGEPGDRLLVEVVDDGHRVEAQVTLARDGSASPSTIDGRRTAKGAAPSSRPTSAGKAPEPPATAQNKDKKPTPPDVAAQRDWR
jgi:hypothetical protein